MFGRWLLPLALCLGLSACDENGRRERVREPQLDWGPGSTVLFRSGAGQLGHRDWVLCLDMSCLEFSDFGLRFGEDGIVTVLDTSDLQRPGRSGATYCHDGTPIGRYTVFADALIIELELGGGELQTWYWEASAEIALLRSWDQQGKRGTTWAKTLDPAADRGSCSRALR